MDDPLLVRRLQRVGDLSRVGETGFEGKRTVSDHLVEAFAFDELHDENVLPPRFFE